ncbi:uncharacterized protein LOC142231001 [Haematobia irritans]|uniref:uncharacterized protein LOC142231001 n=1 Tax=Haematobia irritans TaxID=7368 RepID=UPI003F50CF4C
MSANKHMFIISAYYPAGNNNKHFKNDFMKLFEQLKLDNLNNFYILAGDLNSKHICWGNESNNDKGISLNDWIKDNVIQYRCRIYASIWPSYPRSGSYLDICIADSRLFIHKLNDSINCLETLDYDSDHNAIKIVFSQSPDLVSFEFMEQDNVTSLDYKKTNWKKFERTILDNLKKETLIPNNINLSNSEIEEHLDRLKSEPDSNKYILRKEEDICDVIGAYMESIYSSKNIDDSNITHIAVSEFFSSFSEQKMNYENNMFITRDEITYIFSNLKGKSSSGLDEIPNIILKNIPKPLVFEYLTLFNNMINNAFFPSKWKRAKVIILSKKDKDLTDPKNLRAISLLPNISKIFEMAVNNLIQKNCQKLNLICEKQFGFKHRHSTIHAINLLVSNIQWNWNQKMYTGACLIDYEKAFDSVWIPGLIKKLVDYNFPLHLTRKESNGKSQQQQQQQQQQHQNQNTIAMISFC